MELPISSKSEFSLSDAPDFELEESSSDADSLDCDWLPKVYSENLQKRDDRPGLYYRALIFSLVIHLVLFWGIAFAYYHPDKRPIKEVHTWVVNLVPLIKDEPKGLKEGPPQNIIAESKTTPLLSNSDQVIQPAHKMNPFSEAVATLEESPLPLSNMKASEELDGSSSSRPSEAADKKAPPNQTMNESVSQQVQAGQYLFRMKMNDQMLGYKFKYFQKSTRAQLVALIQASVSEEVLKRLPGKAAVIRIFYPENDSSQEVTLDPESDAELGEILKEKIRWDTVSSPKKLGLPNQTVKVSVAIDTHGIVNLKLSLL